jgi:DNA-binding transcriptional LysR family regulator
VVDLNDLALFVNVVNAGSFAEAARRLGLPPNTASRRVQELERDLGVRLMQRSTRRLTLTDAGQRLFTECATQVEAVTRSAQEVSEDNTNPSGKIRVAVPADFFEMVPVDIMSEFLVAHPRVRLEFILSDNRADLLGEGIDVALRIGRVIEPNLVACQVGWTALALVASPAYIDARGAPGLLADLSDHDCIAVPTNATGYVTWRLDGPEGEVEFAVRGRFHANSMQTMINASLGGLGIALAPVSMTRAHVEAGRLQRVLPDYGLRRVGVYFVYLHRRQLPRAVSAFITFMLTKVIDGGLVEPVTHPT